jgi:hypothetical protein
MHDFIAMAIKRDGDNDWPGPRRKNLQVIDTMANACYTGYTIPFHNMRRYTKLHAVISADRAASRCLEFTRHQHRPRRRRGAR